MKPWKDYILQFSILFGVIALFSAVSEARHFSFNLKSANGNFVVAENGGGERVNANRSVAGVWETFTLIDKNFGELEDNDEVAIKTHSGNFFSAINGGGGRLLADKTALVTWETFKIIRVNRRSGDSRILDGDSVAFESMTKNYVSAVNGGGGELNAKSTFIGNPERFTIKIIGEPKSDKLSGPVRELQWIIPTPTGVDESTRSITINSPVGSFTPTDLMVICRNNYLGSNFPNCYRGHEGTDFGLTGSFLKMDRGSLDVFAVAAGLVVGEADGNPDRCYFKFPPPAPNSKSVDAIHCPNDPENKKEANLVMVLQDDGVLVHYVHLKKGSVQVKRGDRVECGQFLGKIGSSGISSAPHLHLTFQRIRPFADLQKIKADADGKPTTGEGTIKEVFRKYPTTLEDFRNFYANDLLTELINPYAPMLWKELSGRLPKKTCGEVSQEETCGLGQSCPNRLCKLGLIFKDGVCKKIGIVAGRPCDANQECLPGLECNGGVCKLPPPPSCGNCPPFTECKDGKCVPKKP